MNSYDLGDYRVHRHASEPRASTTLTLCAHRSNEIEHRAIERRARGDAPGAHHGPRCVSHFGRRLGSYEVLACELQVHERRVLEGPRRGGFRGSYPGRPGGMLRIPRCLTIFVVVSCETRGTFTATFTLRGSAQWFAAPPRRERFVIAMHPWPENSSRRERSTLRTYVVSLAGLPAQPPRRDEVRVWEKACINPTEQSRVKN